MKKIILSFILGILSGIVIFTLGVLIPIFISTLPLGFNLQKLPKAYTVLSGSMEPAINVGSFVISKPSSFYSKGDIITFSLNGNKKNLITHRIEAKLFPDGVDKEPVYLTSGDANEDFDTGFVKNENIIGKVVFTVPYLGYFANFAKTPKGLLLLVIIPATIVIYEELKSLGSQFLRGVKKLRKKKKRVSIPPNDWSIIEDGKKGTLTFEPVYPTFKFNFEGSGLDPREEYCLIYYADGWPGSHPGYFLKSGSPDPSGNLSLSDNVDIGINLPDPADANYPSGAKIWLVDCSSYNKTTLSLTGWNPNSPDWLFETRLIKYTRVVPSPTPTAIPAPSPTPGGGSPSPTTIYLDHLGGDIGDQYGYWLDYTNASSNNLYFSSLSPVPSKLSGT